MLRIGDDVKLRTWGSLANEYGENEAGDVLVYDGNGAPILALSDCKAAYGLKGFILSISPHGFAHGVFNGRDALINDGLLVPERRDGNAN